MHTKRKPCIMSLDPSNKGEKQGRHTQACRERLQKRTESDETKDNGVLLEQRWNGRCMRRSVAQGREERVDAVCERYMLSMLGLGGCA